MVVSLSVTSRIAPAGNAALDVNVSVPVSMLTVGVTALALATSLTGSTSTSTLVLRAPLVKTGIDVVLMKRNWPATEMRTASA